MHMIQSGSTRFQSLMKSFKKAQYGEKVFRARGSPRDQDVVAAVTSRWGGRQAGFCPAASAQPGFVLLDFSALRTDKTHYHQRHQSNWEIRLFCTFFQTVQPVLTDDPKHADTALYFSVAMHGSIGNTVQQYNSRAVTSVSIQISLCFINIMMICTYNEHIVITYYYSIILFGCLYVLNVSIMRLKKIKGFRFQTGRNICWNIHLKLNQVYACYSIIIIFY